METLRSAQGDITEALLECLRSQLRIGNTERMELVFRLVFKTSSGRITTSVAGSIPALSAIKMTNDEIRMTNQ